MRALLDRLIRRKPDPNRGMFISSSGANSLLEFRSEIEPLVVAPRPIERPFRMEPQRARAPIAPVLIFALLIATSAGIIAYWWSEAATSNAAAAPAGGSGVNGPVPGTAASAAGASAASSAGPSHGAPVTGSIDVSSDPPGAIVLIDGTKRGVSPLVVGELSPGPHEVSIVANGATLNRSVTVTAGTTSMLLASVAAARPDVGWIAIDMPFEAEILERGRLLGTTSSARLALPAGWHDLELRNAGLGFLAPLGVQIVSGQTARPSVAAPTGLVSVNALPWAEVLIDGRSVGTTPLANLPVAIGPHLVVLRHPQLGERKRNIQVTGAAPVRIGLSFTE